MSEVKPLYTWSLKDAVEYGEVDQWRESYKENCDCAREIERTISSHYRNNILEDCANDIIGRYGFDRVNYVLANLRRVFFLDNHNSYGVFLGGVIFGDVEIRRRRCISALR